jgi:hypothetical protein
MYTMGSTAAACYWARVAISEMIPAWTTRL